MADREYMDFDVVVVGAGPAGLSAAIRLKQIDNTISVCVVEKGSEVGAHILSGAVLEPRALKELFPDWKERGAPLLTPAKSDKFLFLSKKRSFRLPTPPQMHNSGNYIVSLANVCRWLAEQAAGLGVEIYPGFPVTEAMIDENGAVCGVITGDFGIGRDGQKKDSYQPGVGIRARYTLLAEGCRGSVSKQLIKRYSLSDGSNYQTYGIGIKEIWQVLPEKHKAGSITHSVGWPLDTKTYGGSFVYHLENNQVAVGFVVGLDYENPYLDPFQELQSFKTHPAIRPLFEDGKRLAYGARALNEGGLQSIPKLSFPGGAIIGCAAGFLNVPKVKGTHTAMKSGMLAAEAVAERIKSGGGLENYEEKIKKSWIYKELCEARNIRPAFRFGLLPGLIYAAIDTYIFRGRAPWTFRHHPDHASFRPARASRKIEYPKPDGTVTFDRLSSVFLSSANHEEDQPVHLRLADPSIPITYNLKEYDAPEQRFCPAGVYEIIRADGQPPRLQINAQNCVHCKTCDIKDPKQNITWVPPEGGGGPNYPNM